MDSSLSIKLLRSNYLSRFTISVRHQPNVHFKSFFKELSFMAESLPLMVKEVVQTRSRSRSISVDLWQKMMNIS